MLNERQLYALNHPFAAPVECRAYANRVPKASAKAKFEAEILEKEALMREYYGIGDFAPSRLARYDGIPPVISVNTSITNGAMDRFIRALGSYEYQRVTATPRSYDRIGSPNNGQTLQSRNETREAARSANVSQTQAALNRLLGI